MLTITIPKSEQFDEVNNVFSSSIEQTLKLEHSLVSLAKWESKWNRPFLSAEAKTIEESIDYIRCMTLTQNVKSELYNFITEENMRQVSEYIEACMTATVFLEEKSKKNKEIITAEIIYFWMISLNIPIECQKWHLNRLLTLINVCNVKNQKPKKMSKKELNARNHDLNAQRRKQLNTEG